MDDSQFQTYKKEVDSKIERQLAIILVAALLLGIFLIFGVIITNIVNSSKNSDDNNSVNGNNNIDPGPSEVILYNLKSGSTVGSPLVVTGEAKRWFHEGQFSIDVIDSEDRKLGSGVAIAETNWQVDDYVPFRAEIKFNPGENEAGKILFKKSNPSGNPTLDRNYEVRVLFRTLDIQVNDIYPGKKISSPIVITGSARNWFVNGSFDVALVDSNNNVISKTAAISEEDSSLKTFIPFKAALEFKLTNQTQGKLIFISKNMDVTLNPSRYEIPVTF